MKNKKKKVSEILMLFCLCFIPLIISTGCGANSCVRMTTCGDNDTRLILYAKGVDENGVEYTSCVGPAGCLGLGLNSKCWPTECVKIRTSSDGTEEITGCVTYYNETGCIANSEVKSNGSYSTNATCFGISLCGNEYKETVAESVQANKTSTCFGISCGQRQQVEPLNYNSKMPRAFPKGCWTSDK
ncbi:MAG: hypothetical protein Q4F06_07105 [Eubacteriales bacterium]|nr:hypothetical protein [Eubacteriales bacterium]